VHQAGALPPTFQTGPARIHGHLASKSVVQVWEKRLVRGSAKAMMVGLAKEYARYKAYRRYVASNGTVSQVHGSTKTVTLVVDLNQMCELTGLLMQLESIQRLASRSAQVTCVEWKTVNFGDYTIRDGRHFVYEEADSISLGSVFSLRSIGDLYFVLFRQYPSFEIHSGSLHVRASSLEEQIQIIEFHANDMSFSRSEIHHPDTGMLHIDI